jgi:EAL domain-containing protein (putative c-di-GMP-specific phosphodiesterase class I)
VLAISFPGDFFVLEPPEEGERSTPGRALALAGLALFVAAGLALLRPEQVQEAWGLAWILALAPTFLLSYYRGWTGAVVALAGGMLALTLTEVVGRWYLGRAVDWWVVAGAGAGILVVSVALGVMTELLHRSGGDPHLAERRWQTGRALRRALETESFELHYQPIVGLEDLEVVGAEALLRWQHPEAGLLPPELFLPTAESTGLAVPLGRRVIDRAASDVGRLRGIFDRDDLFVTVNLTAGQCREPAELVEAVRSGLAESGLAASSLMFEIGEEDVLEAADAVVELESVGCAVLIDDFGNRQASLSQLGELPVAGLKVDRTFTAGIVAEERKREVVHTTIDLGRRLGMDVFMEGIERRDQLVAVRKAGADYGQGFLFAPPAPLTELIPPPSMPGLGDLGA